MATIIKPTDTGERVALVRRKQQVKQQLRADLQLIPTATATQQREIVARMLRVMMVLVELAD